MFLISNRLEQLEFRLEKDIGIWKHAGKVRKGPFHQNMSTFLRLSLFFCRKTYVDDVLVHPGICNIPIVDGQSLTNREFLKQFAYESPFVLRDATDNIVSCDQDQRLTTLCTINT